MVQNIIYEDEELLVVYKPAKIAVQTKRFGQMDMESLLKNYLAGKEEGCPAGRAVPYLAVIHRLDQPVEGLLVFAKTPEAAADLSAQASGKDSMRKEYLAVVCGRPDQLKGQLRDWLLKDGRTNTSRAVPKGTKGAKEALLQYELLETCAGRSLLRIRLQTGRHHQIRVQFAHAGLPLFGDSKYNPDPGEGSVALCADQLTFSHPKSGKRLTFSCRPQNPAFAKFQIPG